MIAFVNVNVCRCCCFCLVDFGAVIVAVDFICYGFIVLLFTVFNVIVVVGFIFDPRPKNS